MVREEEILKAVESQLGSFRVFVAPISDQRKRERMEPAIMQHIYCSQEPWSDLADRGMLLNGRYNAEMPILIENKCDFNIYGLPKKLEI